MPVASVKLEVDRERVGLGVARSKAALPSQRLQLARLDLASGRRHFRLSRYHASDELSFFIEHFWIVEWELPENRTYRQQSLPHPSVHIAFVGQTPDDWARSLGTGTT